MLWWYSCNLGVVLEDEQVYFTTDTELWQIDAWLDGAAGVWEQDAVILCFIVVEVGAVAVEDGADVVAGTVDEVVRVVSLGDYRAGDVVYLPALDGLVIRQPLAYEGDGRVSCSFDDFEDFALAEGDLFTGACEGHPGIVGVDCARVGQVRPEVEEDQVTALDGAVIGGGGFVVRVAGVGVDGYVRDIGDGACLLQEGEKALLDAVFIEWLIRTQPVAKFLEEGVLGGDDALAGLAVGGYLFTGQLGLETLGYTGRTDYLYAK